MPRPRPRRSPWRELALVASLLACGICQASAQISIISFVNIEGFSSSLHLQNVPEGIQEYIWHRGANDSAENMIVSYKPPSSSWRSGPMFSGRENVTKKGNLEIKDSMLNDTGYYTVRVDLSNGSQRATGWLEIQELESDPVISANTSFLAENLDPLTAFCHTNATNATIEWFVNSARVFSNERMTISPDGKTLVIHQLSRYDFLLQCAIESVIGIPQKSELLFLTVNYGPDNMMVRTMPEKSGNVLSAEIGSQVQMNCSSTSSPRSKYRWVHKGSILSSEASISLPSLAREQMGKYRCIVENPVTQLLLYQDIWIRKPWKAPVISTGFFLSGPVVVVFIVMTVLGGVYLCGVLIYLLINHFCTRTITVVAISVIAGESALVCHL
uniref:CEA cell adhesion molecule 18 n=1 Tax=Molossus molossus TaxID=27622 RepID=A0A7J8C6B2_MOLMO|nr:CEA cell adhesion molecule 18 [Molossus molossus]